MSNKPAVIKPRMQPARIPVDEGDRLKTLQALQILDSSPSESYDRITRFVAKALDMPIVLVSLVDADRQWFKSRVGLDATETPRDVSFCGHVVFDRKPLVVPDAMQDERFADNPLVTGAPHVRAYMGVPLLTHQGYAIGTLCAIDSHARDFSKDDLGVLADYAMILQESIQAQELARATEGVLQFATEREMLFHDTFNQAAVGITHVSVNGQLLRVNQRTCDMLGYQEPELHEVSFADITHPEDLAEDMLAFQQMLAGDLEQYRLEKRFRCKNTSYLWTEVSVALKRSSTSEPDYVIAVIVDISARKRAEAALMSLRDTLRLQVIDQTVLLHETNHALRREVDQSHDSERSAREAMRALKHFQYALDQHASVAVTDINGVITYANKRFCDLSGYSASELIGQTHAIVKSGVHAPAVFEDMWRTISAGLMWRGELCNRNKSGTCYWVDACIVPDKDEAGQITQFVSIRVDITQRKLDRELMIAADTRSRQINERLRQIADSLPVMISYWNKDQICQFANAAHFQRFGLRPQQVVGMSAEELLGDAWGESRRRHMEAALRGEYQSFDISGNMADGSLQHWQIEYIPHLIESQGVVGFYSLVVDITERKLAEQQLARQEAILAATSRMAEIGGWELERDALGPRWSEMVYRIHELPEGRMPALGAALNFYPPEWRGVVAEAVEAAFEKARPFDFVVPFITATGRHRWVRSIGEPQVSDGQVTHILGALQDVTQQKLLESDLAQAQKLESIGQLSAGIAHEINTPTQFIGNNIGFLKESVIEVFGVLDVIAKTVAASADSSVDKASIERALGTVDLSYLLEEVPRAIDQSIEGVERIQKIVSAMKEFSHPAIDKALVDLNRAISSTIIVASNEWKYVAELETHFDENLPSVLVMPGGFNQVILNMIVNAAHAVGDAAVATAAKGLISISTQRIEEWAEIRIRDTGCGIPESIRGRIFDPFFTTKAVGKGTGQGLAIAHDVIVNKHGGTIAVTSELGLGTTFILRLPLINLDRKALTAA